MNEIGKALVAQYYQALADLDVEAFLSLHQDDVVYNVNGSTPVSGRFEGKEFLQNVVAPEVFGGYDYDSRGDGFVASAETAIFDLAYLAAMNRSRVGAHLPETDLRGLRWSEVKAWVARIPAQSMRPVVLRNLQRIREEHG